MDSCTAYAHAVIVGKLPAGPWVRGSCLRHLADLERSQDADSEFYYDPRPLAAFQAFCGILRQYQDPWAGRPVELMPWQCFIAGSILGWKKRLSNLRRFDLAYVEVPRKNGKSAFASALILYMFIMDGEAGAQCYTLATKEEQAKIVYSDALRFFPPDLRHKYFRTKWKVTESLDGNSKLMPLGGNSNTLDGLNPHFACADELHAWKDRNLWDVIVSGMGARLQPLMFGITTGGFLAGGICYELRETAILLSEDAGRGKVGLRHRFCYVAAPSAADAKLWKSERVWFIANPALGTVKRLEYMRQQLDSAEARKGQIREFKAKQLDIWSEGGDSMLDTATFDESAHPQDAVTLACVGRECWGGLDLSSNNDLTAFSLYFPPEENGEGLKALHLWLTWQWVPKDCIQEKERLGMPYSTWVSDGWLRTTQGNATDYRVVRKDIIGICAAYNVQAVAYDPMFATESAIELGEAGLEMLAMGQTFTHMHPPLHKLELLIARGEIGQVASPVLRWQWGNTNVIYNAGGLMRLNKGGSATGVRAAKIDGPASQVMALGCHLGKMGDAETPPENII